VLIDARDQLKILNQLAGSADRQRLMTAYLDLDTTWRQVEKFSHSAEVLATRNDLTKVLNALNSGQQKSLAAALKNLQRSLRRAQNQLGW
jgi:hypothetical protein